MPGEVTVIVVGPVMVQLNVAAPVAEVASVTVTVTELVPTAVGVPAIDPVLALMLRPAGKPVAEKFRVWFAWLSDAPIATGAIVAPSVLVRAPGLLTLTLLPPGLLTVQANDAVPDAPVVSVAVILTMAL